MIRAVAANKGLDIAAGEPIIFIFQLAISGRSHEGVDIAGERIIFYFPARNQRSQPTRAWTSQAGKVESPLDEMTNPSSVRWLPAP
jgi:hypothetical protein